MQRSDDGHAAAALKRLRGALAAGPVLAGPFEMGLLLQDPRAGAAIGADHYVLVLAADGDLVRFHDPDGYPYATLPAGAPGCCSMAHRSTVLPGRKTLPIDERGFLPRPGALGGVDPVQLIQQGG